MTAEVRVDPRPASPQSGNNKRGGSNSSHKCQNSWPSLSKDLPEQFTKIEVVAKIVTSTLTFNDPVTLRVIGAQPSQRRIMASGTPATTVAAASEGELLSDFDEFRIW